jgi:copper chaperone CopZ
MTKQVFKIVGMHCTSCALTIDLDLEEEAGIKSAKTNYAKSIAEIEYDEQKISPQQIISVIAKSGYSATL